MHPCPATPSHHARPAPEPCPRLPTPCPITNSAALGEHPDCHCLLSVPRRKEISGMRMMHANALMADGCTMHRLAYAPHNPAAVAGLTHTHWGTFAPRCPPPLPTRSCPAHTYATAHKCLLTRAHPIAQAELGRAGRVGRRSQSGVQSVQTSIRITRCARSSLHPAVFRGGVCVFWPPPHLHAYPPPHFVLMQAGPPRL